VRALAASPDGRWLATGSFDATLRFYDLSNGASFTLKNDTGAIAVAAFSPDSKTLATGSLNGDVKLWNVALRRAMIIFKAHSTVVSQVIFSPDGSLLVSCGDPALRAWFAPKLEEIDLEGNHRPIWSTPGLNKSGFVQNNADRPR
jgi:WD40 repeat protein